MKSRIKRIARLNKANTDNDERTQVRIMLTGSYGKCSQFRFRFFLMCVVCVGSRVSGTIIKT